VCQYSRSSYGNAVIRRPVLEGPYCVNYKTFLASGQKATERESRTLGREKKGGRGGNIKASAQNQDVREAPNGRNLRRMNYVLEKGLTSTNS